MSTDNRESIVDSIAGTNVDGFLNKKPEEPIRLPTKQELDQLIRDTDYSGLEKGQEVWFTVKVKSTIGNQYTEGETFVVTNNMNKAVTELSVVMYLAYEGVRYMLAKVLDITSGIVHPAGIRPEVKSQRHTPEEAMVRYYREPYPIPESYIPGWFEAERGISQRTREVQNKPIHLQQGRRKKGGRSAWR